MVRRLKRRRSSRSKLGVDRLEDRRLLAVTPGITYQSASYFDADGDLVEIQVTGSGGGGFKVELAGLASDRADATKITLVGFASVDDGLQVTVTPQAIGAQPGGSFATIYSSGYTNVAVLNSETSTAIGGIHLSAAVVNSVSLAGVQVGSITLDAGQTPFVDRINALTPHSEKDSELYRPVTAYVSFGNITAASIGSLVIDGAISAQPGVTSPNPYDSSLTNDFRGVVNVSGAIGEVVGLRSSLTGAIRADSIGAVRIGNIFGEITTHNAAQAMAIDMPKAFKGFVNAAGHLHLGFVTPLPLGMADIAGLITAGGGISGSDRSSEIDAIFLPGGVKSAFVNQSPTVGIASVNVDGEAGITLSSVSGIGTISAGSFAAAFVASAGTSISGIIATSGPLGGSFTAGTDIGPVVASAGMKSASLVADGSIGTVTASVGGISDVSLVAGGNVGLISGSIHAGTAVEKLKVEAGGSVAGITGVSAGNLGALAGTGIGMLSVVANSIGPVTGRSAGGTGIMASTLTSRVGNIGALTGEGWMAGLSQVVAVAATDIVSITGTASLAGAGIDGGSFDANFGSIGQITARGGFGISGARFQATDAVSGGIAGMMATAVTNGFDAINEATIHASTIGAIVASVEGGVDGNGIVGGAIRAFSGAIGAITVDVRSTKGSGIVSGKIEAEDDIGPMNVKAFNASAILGGEFISRGNFGAIYAESTHGGSAIDGATFSAPGRNFSLPVPPLPDVEAIDPKGNFAAIEAFAGGADALAHGISAATFTAIGDIGPIQATSRGGAGITGSTFTADSNNDYAPAAPGRPWLAAGTITEITVVSAGRNATSGGIGDSAFLAANIGDTLVDVQMVEAGDAIAASRFEAQTRVYDGFGNYDNTGTIGNIVVRNRSNASGGISTSGIANSEFAAGAAGGIGNITVTTGRGAAGITGSRFLLATDLDQNLFTGAIGNITVDVGRVSFSTALPAGVVDSQFLAAAGIGTITVDAVGGGIVKSTFDGKASTFLPDQIDIPGPIGTILVRVPGRQASAVTDSTFSGSSIGNVSVLLTDNAAKGLDAVARSTFTARTGAIGNVTVVHSDAGGPGSPGIGFAILNSTWRAATAIGSVTIVGRTFGAQFIVTGSPIVGLGFLQSVGALNGHSIGPVSVSGSDSTGITFDTTGSIGDLTFENLVTGSTVFLQLAATSIGSLGVSAVGAFANASLNLVARAGTIGNIVVDGNLVASAIGTTTMGNVTVGGNASLTATSLATLGNLAVTGALTLPQGLAKLKTAGTFSAGSLAALAKGRTIQIGAKTTPGSSIGKVTIGQANRSPGIYQFAFKTFLGQPTSATVGGKNFNAATGAGRLVNGVRLIGARPVVITVKAPTKKK